jgi:hypothetical protein
MAKKAGYHSSIIIPSHTKGKIIEPFGTNNYWGGNCAYLSGRKRCGMMRASAPSGSV